MPFKNLETEKRSFKTKKQYPKELSPQERAQKIITAIEEMQAVERDYIGKDRVDIKISHNRPVMILTIADLHMGSIATNYKEITKLKNKILSHNDIAIVLLGDEIEGLKSAYLDTNTARTIGDVHQQIELVRESFIAPLAKEGKILALVSGYFGHPGWTQDQSTINTWMMLADDYDIPIVRNGGVLSIKYENGHQQSMQIFHNAPGRSKFDPVHGLRQVLQNWSLPQRPNIAVAGHSHKAGVAKEYQPMSRRNRINPQAMVIINTGTAKGSSPDVPPDRFGVKLGFPLTDSLGQGVVLGTRRRSGGRKLEANYPFISTKHGFQAFYALQLLNYLEQKAMTAEMKEKIQAEVEKAPKIEFKKRSSKQVFDAHDENPEEKIQDTYGRWNGLSPQYDTVRFNVKTKLPIAVDFIQNIRMGSNAEGYKKLKNYMQKRFSENPYALMAFLRNLVDVDVAKDLKRTEVLNKLIQLGKQYQNQVLVVLHDSNLRAKSWKKSLGGKDNRIPPIPAGSTLARGMNAQLIRHGSVIEMAVGPKKNMIDKPLYSILALDKLENSGSRSKATFGHNRFYDLHVQTKPGSIVGGHVKNSGFSTRFDKTNPETNTPFFIQPGWWANTVNSRGNAGKGAMPGQALILMPGASAKDYLAFPTANDEETQYLHEAFLLWKGLEILGLLDKI